MTFVAKKKSPWYVGGLHFECAECGNCCSGPAEGYIWLTKQEIKFIADFLKEPVEQVRQKYMKRVGLRTTIIENPITKDCVFLKKTDGQPAATLAATASCARDGTSRQVCQHGGEKRCVIYRVRPNQCRIWPFWADNLAGPNNWNQTVLKCRGINRGKLYSFEAIEKIKRQKQWWDDGGNSRVAKKTAEIYKQLDLQVQKNDKLCQTCGKCCNFKAYDHRLFVTSVEMIYLVEKLGSSNIKKMPTGVCPYNIDSKCSIYENRFAGCRIFQCNGDSDLQSKLSEKTIKKFKSICKKLDLPYRYSDLASSLNGFG